ncbi:MAG: efflux transporter outer membrane subunit [Pseudomonadota bacterium]
MRDDNNALADAAPRVARLLRPWLLSAIAVAALTACGTPRAPSAAAPLDTSFVQAAPAPSTPAGDTDTRTIATFWREFRDPGLDALVDQALIANTDLRLAQARLQEARATAGLARADGLPVFGLEAGVARADPAGPLPLSTQYSTGATFNWEIDFFGRNRSARAAAAALVSASEAGVHAAQRLIAAEVASNYLSLRTLQQRLRVAEESLLNQRESLRIVDTRESLGRGTPLDVARARSLVDSTEALLPALQAAIDRTAYRLATLTGQTPRTVGTALRTAQALPTLATTDLSALPLGTPQRLLQRRPDLQAAQRQVEAADANIQLARADLFPRITLSGVLGFVAPRVGDLGQRETRNHSAGAFLDWTPFDFGRVRSRIDINEARAEQAWLLYQQTVQVAIEETEGALAQYTGTVQQTARLESAARNAAEAARLARLRFDAGATDFLTVLDAERNVLQAQDALVQAQGGTLNALVAVYRALGGGWTE